MADKQVAKQHSLWDDLFNDSWFYRPLPVAFRQEVSQWSPRCDIAENKDSYSVHAELPGVKKDDIQMHFDSASHVLSIKGESKSEKRDDHEKYHRTERRYGSFERNFTLPNNVDGDNIVANMADGVLNVTIPKVVKEEKKKKQIDIQ